jgi:hypothetical protein
MKSPLWSRSTSRAGGFGQINRLKPEKGLMEHREEELIQQLAAHDGDLRRLYEEH